MRSVFLNSIVSSMVLVVKAGPGDDCTFDMSMINDMVGKENEEICSGPAGCCGQAFTADNEESFVCSTEDGMNPDESKYVSYECVEEEGASIGMFAVSSLTFTALLGVFMA